MKMITERSLDVVVVTLPEGTLDASNTQSFKREVENVLRSNARVVLDLGRVTFVDSAGVGAILACLRRLNAEGGDLKLCGLTKPVRALFELIRMHKIFEIFNSAEEAVAAFS